MKSLVELLKESRGAALKDRTPDRFPEPKKPGKYLAMQDELDNTFWYSVEDEISARFGELFEGDTLFIGELFTDCGPFVYEDDGEANITLYLHQDFAISLFRFLGFNYAEEETSEAIYNMTSAQMNLFKSCGIELDEGLSTCSINFKNLSKYANRTKAFKTLQKDVQKLSKMIGGTMRGCSLSIEEDKDNPNEISMSFGFYPDTCLQIEHKYKTKEFEDMFASILVDFIKNFCIELRDTLNRAF